MSTMASQKLILVVAMAVVAVATSSPWAPAPSRVVDPEEAEALSLLRHTRVVITNALEGREQLQVHCKDKKEDFGQVVVPYNTTYTLSFYPSLFSADYFCSFGFDNTLHWFDIYVWSRDFGKCKTCIWSVHQAGPCFHDSLGSRKCYSWNRN